MTKGQNGKDYRRLENGSYQSRPPPNKFTGPPRILTVPFFFSILMFIIFLSQKSRMVPKITVIYPSRQKSQHTPETQPINALDKSPERTQGEPTTSSQVCGAPKKTGPLIRVGDSKTLIVASYVEHRREPKTILTITIGPRSERKHYYCLLCCEGKIITSQASYTIHSDHFNFPYGTADVTCPIPDRCTTPEYVALSYESNEVEHVPEKAVFLPILNQQPKKESFPYEFTVCISVMYNYTNVLQLVQAMEMFRMLGVQRVVIYKTSCSLETQRVLDYYVKESFVEIVNWTLRPYISVSRGWQMSADPGELHYFGQIPALNDCVYRYMYQTHYIALQDMDELILPLNVDNWTELLPLLEERYGKNAGFAFENHEFPYAKLGRKDYMLKDWRNVPGINILQRIYKVPNNQYTFSNTKVIVNPRLVFKTSVHGLLDSVAQTHHVDPSIAHIYHVKNTSGNVKEDDLIRDERLWHYASKLIPSVSNVLEKTKLISDS